MVSGVTPSSTRGPSRWLQLTACIVAMMSIANLQYAWTLFTVPLTESLGASLSDVQIAFTIFILLETWLVPVEGYLIDKLGARLIVACGSILVALGWVGSASADTLSQLYFWYGVGGIGAGAVYGASVGTALKWFPDRRGLAAGLVAGSYGFGTALTIIPIQNMIDSSGYRQTFIAFGILQGVLVLVASQFLRSPANGWRPAGWEGVSAKAAVVQSAVSYTPAQMVRTTTFWGMYLMMALVASGGLMITAQLKPIAAVYGLDQRIVAFGVTALGLALILDRIMNGLTRPFWGWVSDHIGRYNAMAIAFTLGALGKMALLFMVTNPLLFVILSGFVFFAWGEIFSLFPAAIGDIFGPRYATTNYGIQYTAKGTASIFAGWGAAVLVESTGSWIPIFWVTVVFDLAAAAMAFFWLKGVAARLVAEREASGGGTMPAAAPATAGDWISARDDR